MFLGLSYPFLSSLLGIRLSREGGDWECLDVCFCSLVQLTGLVRFFSLHSMKGRQIKSPFFLLLSDFVIGFFDTVLSVFSLLRF